MKRMLATCLAFAGLIELAGPVMAELSFHQDRLSVNLQEAPLKDVLKDLAYQGAIDLTVLETEKMRQAIVTEQFQDVSVEEGLQRLLAEWNYGLTKHRVTGRVREIFVASKRIDPGTALKNEQSPASSRYPHSSQEDLLHGDSMIASFPEDEGSDELGIEDSTDLDHDVSDTDVTEDMLPEDLSSEIREELLRDIRESRKGR